MLKKETREYVREMRLVIASSLSQVYPEAAQFQYKELPFPDKLELIFAGVIDAEGMEISYSRKKQNDNSDSSFMQSEEQDFANV